jgi:hypothetical protein
MDFRQSETMSLKKWDKSSSVIHTKDSRSECTEPPLRGTSSITTPSKAQEAIPSIG